MNFKTYWQLQNSTSEEYLVKARLTTKELKDIQKTIADLQQKGFSSSKIIKQLQKANGKLVDYWKAERAYYTEVKAMETKVVGQASEELGLDTYKTILSPNACEICKSKSNNGTKIFKSNDLHKSGYGHIPPFHPNCYCILIPY